MEGAGGEESKADVSSLLEVNRLDYRLPPSLSIATSRAMKVYRAQQSTYIAGGQQIQFTLSSGATYVDFLNSHLKFQVVMPTITLAAINPKFSPYCGWANMIEQIRIVHSSGVEVDRLKNGVGEFMQIQNYYGRSQQTRRTQGALYSLNDYGRPGSLVSTNELIETAKGGLNRTQDVTPAVGVALPLMGDDLKGKVNEAFDQNTINVGLGGLGGKGMVFDVCIPLPHLLGFFDVDLLAPSFLSAGLQVLAIYQYVFSLTPFF